jgi:hypothetical protein
VSWARTKSRATAAPRGPERRADGFERIAGAGVDCVRDTEPTRAGQLGVVDVAADDPGRRDRAQDLHGHWPSPPRPITTTVLSGVSSGSAALMAW